MSGRRPLTWSFVLGVLGTIVASVVVAVVAFLITRAILDDDDDDNSRPPPEAVPGEIVVGLTEPLEYGDFRFLPADATGTPCDPKHPDDLGRADVEMVETENLDELRDHDLFLEPPYLPEGTEPLSAYAETIVWEDDSRTDSQFNLTIDVGEGELPLQLSRTQLGDDCKLEYVEPEGQTEEDPPFTLDEIRGEPVFYRGRIWVEVIIDHVVTRIAALNPRYQTDRSDEITKILEGIIEQLQSESDPA